MFRVDVFSLESVRPIFEIQGVISCRTPQRNEDAYFGADLMLRDKFRDVLVLEFHDITPSNWSDRDGTYLGYIPFNEDHAKQILDFVKDRDSLVIHCDAGMSRSVAIGCFLRDNFDAYVTFHATHGSDEYRNRHVYNVLTRVFLGEPEKQFLGAQHNWQMQRI